ncbi:helix-turn-helix domain-containing protein [Pseudonocardia spinosispora]|uniref:helix-turn-helix domain-containing protein n=1 Tax=Pseudonocardia spinosispora TaxID=103441 RepID=UPI000491E363|nr:helix-turn-helix transcriptional regulator [Pseudonocardia spinosispora]
MGGTARGKRRQLGRRLKVLRNQMGLTTDEVAIRMEMSSSALNRVELGGPINIHALRSLLDLFGVTYDRWPEFENMLRAGAERGWWHAFGLKDKGYVPLEADATLVREYNPIALPGLLQTSDYAKALFTGSGELRSDERLRNDIAVRMIRQKRLTSTDDPIELISVIPESLLHQRIGSLKLMDKQLAHLIKLAALDTVTLQVIPSEVGAHPAMSGMFILLSFDDLGEPDVVYVEHAVGAVNSDKEALVEGATLKFEQLRAVALSPEDSIALIRKIAEQP